MDKKNIYGFSIDIKKLINEGKLAEAESKITQAKLSKEETNFLFMCLSTNGYDPETDRFLLFESDNSAFLKLVNTVKSSLVSRKK